jgi:hypothetical protein
MYFGKYKKTKYQLNVNKHTVYSFVTTNYSEEECVELLKQRAEIHRSCVNKWYKIVKKDLDKTEVLFTGKLLALKA